MVPVEGEPAIARVLRYLPGGTLAGAGRYLSPRVVAGLGAVAGQVSLALSSFEHPGLDRVLQWDLRHARRVVDALAGHVRDEDLRGRVTEAAAAAWGRVEPLAGRLPWQAVHGDVTDDNVVCLARAGAADTGRDHRLRRSDQLVGCRRAGRGDHLGAAARRGRTLLGAARGARVR